MTIHAKSAMGLDGVVAAQTALSHVDGERGELVIAGRRVDDLGLSVSFEALTADLWNASGASPCDANEAKRLLGVARIKAHGLLEHLLPATDGMSVVAGLRALIAGLRPVEGLPDEIAIVGAMPVLAAAVTRRAAGLPPVAPAPELGHAADMLRMFRGADVTDAEAWALNAYLVTVIDHGMNASTFAGRVVASTNADLFMATTAAYCALTGPLHGGAPEPVLEMLDEIGTRDNIEPWIDAALARGDRLMGFGHRIYRVRDPRADVLKRTIETLSDGSTDLGLAADVEAYAKKALEKAKPDRRLDTNVEFFTAILLDALDIPRQAFTTVFAAGRASGWTAHAIEQQRTGRLLRPASVYTGPMPD